MPDFRFVGWDSLKGYKTATSTKAIKHFLWGDRVEVVSQAGDRWEVKGRSRSRSFFVDKDGLQGEALLEYYFCDVGQGDGVIIVTPDRKHLLIDGGYPRAKQNTGKSVADFVDWKFYKDYRLDEITLDAVMCSHNDQDHYGGLADILDTEQTDQLDCTSVTIDTFYHAGLSWWKTATKSRTLGRTAKAEGKSHYVDLLTSRTAAERSLRADADPLLQGEWGKFIKKMTKAKTRSGGKTSFQRLSQHQGDMDEFNAPDLSFHVLGPIEASTPKGPGLRKFTGKPGQATNGHSVLLRIDYKNTRVLLTGDLNKQSQRLLLEAYDGQETEFLADVTKACHHGSDDVSFEFLSAINPSATIISSGDAEKHDHPKPSIVGASGITGKLTIKDDEIVTPLVYSTELARSVSLGDPTKLEIPKESGGTQTVAGARFDASRVHYKETKPGDLNPRKRSRSLANTYVVAGQVYGLVNVRTDGHKILCATMNEGDGSWQIKTFDARFIGS